MSLWKKKREISTEEHLAILDELLKEGEELKAWNNNPNRSYKNAPFIQHMTEEEKIRQRQYRRKVDRRNEILDSFFSTLRDIILTPLSPIFGILALISKVVMYGSSISFLYACYKVYKSISGGLGFMSGVKAEWYFFILPFAAAFLYFIFDKFAEYCSDHSLY